MPPLIRPPRSDAGESSAVFAVHRAAFGRNDEARLVERQRAAGCTTFEWHAEQDGGDYAPEFAELTD